MPSTPQPVTVAISRRVRQGREHEFEEWAKRMMRTAETYPGHLGAGLIRSAVPGGEHTIVYRFDTREHFEAWQGSADRDRLVAESSDFVEGTPRQEIATGLEYWFRDSMAGGAMPPVWKQALLTWVGLYPTVLAISYTIALLIAPWPLPLRAIVTSALSVVLMTWVVMPSVTRAFRWWLQPQRA